MSTFQAIIYSVVKGFSEILPVSADAHVRLLSYLAQWEMPDPFMSGITSAAVTLALLVYYRHDWASILSSGLRVLLLWKKPMTFDERMPLFLLLSTLPAAIVWTYASEFVPLFSNEPQWIALSLFLFGIPIWFSERQGKKSRNMFDWNWLDSLVIGFFQIFLFIPGAGRQAIAFSAALLRNYSRDAAAKFLLLTLVPIVAVKSYQQLHHLDWAGVLQQSGTSVMTASVAFFVTFFSSLLAIGGFMKTIQTKGLLGFVTYRFVLASGTMIVFWARS